MASLINCPHCGIRPKEEFAIRGDATVVRPAPHASEDEWHAYVFLRDNPRGRISEYWHHAGGCRRWLVVERDNSASHEVYRVTDAAVHARAVVKETVR